jgi:hypothetical protein
MLADMAVISYISVIIVNMTGKKMDRSTACG